MQEQFIPYDLAVIMRDLGFDETTFTYYTRFSEYNIQLVTYSSATVKELFKDEPETYTKAPLWQQATAWFRERGYYSHVELSNFEGNISYSSKISFTNNSRFGLPHVNISNLHSFKTYEEARLACLEKLIEIVEQEKLK